MKFTLISENLYKDETGSYYKCREGQSIDELIEELSNPPPEPPPPTPAERIDAVFPQTDSVRVIFETFFNMANRLQALERKQPITRAQLLDWMKTIF